MATDDRELLSQLESYIERAYGVRVEHRYDRRKWRRFFSQRSFRNGSNRGSAGRPPSLIEAWQPLDVFRDTETQRDALSALGGAAPAEETLANLMLPVDIISEHRGLTQRMLNSTIDNFLYERHTVGQFTPAQIHQEFTTLLFMSFISDRVIVVETDFSHESNMTIKYISRPLEQKILRMPNIGRKFNLFFSSSINNYTKNSVYIGVHRRLSSVFNHDIGHADFASEGDHSNLGAIPDSGYLVLASRRSDYSCAYILPLYGLINRSSSMISRSQRIFTTFMDILSKDARQKIELNKHHSRARHTIGVELEHTKAAYSELFEERQNILSHYDTGRDHLNVILARVNNSLDEMYKDVENQFATEFDVYGNRREGKAGFGPDELALDPDEFRDFIRQIGDSVSNQRLRSMIVYGFDHDRKVKIRSEGALRNCVTELLNNAVKYNIAQNPIRVRTRNRGEDEVALSIGNIGPAVTEEEANSIPLMGLRGINSQRHVSSGSGQGLAAVFGILEELGIDPEYRPRQLTPEQVARLTQELGTKRLRELDLAYHIVELTFSS